MSKKVGILFDLDGTIIHVPEDFFQVLDKIIRNIIYNLANKSVSLEEIYAFWRSGRKFDEFLHKWGIQDIDSFWKLFDKLDLVERKKMIENGEIYLFEDARNLINELKDNNDILLGIISNTPASIANIEFELINIPYKKIFKEIYLLGTDEQHKAKPQPDSIIEFMTKYQIANECMYIIGDTDLDIRAGENANIKTILIKREHNKSIESISDIKPDYIIENLMELKKILC
ncbi:MAG: HAD family hydrolase [Candidatus Helarchaeota archaeon]